MVHKHMSILDASMKLAALRSSTLQYGNTTEIHDRTLFDFYSGVPPS